MVRSYPTYTQTAKIIIKAVIAVDFTPSLNFKIRIELDFLFHLVSFLMTPEEVTAEDAERQRLYEIRRNISVDDRQTITYETAESGMLIKFPERVSKVNTVIIAKIENP